MLIANSDYDNEFWDDLQSPINDVNAMQNMFLNINHVVNTNFDELAFYTINEEIKIVTTLKKGRYTIPTSPDKWEQAKIEADFLVKESIDNRMLAEIAEEYIKSGGKYRDLTVDEGYTRGLITKTRKTVKDVIFNKEYTKNRKKNIPFDSDNIIHIPHIGDKYTFKAHVEPKFTITNKLIDTLINMDNEFQIKDRSFIELVKEVNKKIEDKIENELEEIDGTSTMIFDNLPYNEKVQIVMLLDKMEETWSEDMWKEFSTSIQLKTVSAGGQNQWYFSVSAEYSQIYDGVDKEEKVYQLFNILKKDEKVLRNKEEKENIKIQIGSLEETITNGNWGE